MDVTFAIADLRREAEIIGELAHAVRGRSVMEVGSGVGLTGLVVTGLCRPSRVSLTDLTDACLTNLAHNVEVVNWDWLEGRGVVTGKGGTLMTVRAPRGLSRCPIF